MTILKKYSELETHGMVSYINNLKDEHRIEKWVEKLENATVECVKLIAEFTDFNGRTMLSIAPLRIRDAILKDPKSNKKTVSFEEAWKNGKASVKMVEKYIKTNGFDNAFNEFSLIGHVCLLTLVKPTKLPSGVTEEYVWY